MVEDAVVVEVLCEEVSECGSVREKVVCGRNADSGNPSAVVNESVESCCCTCCACGLADPDMVETCVSPDEDGAFA